MKRAERRLIDRIAGASVLLPTLLGALGVVGYLVHNGSIEPVMWGVFAIYVGISGVLHVWFRAEDGWRHRRRLRESSLRRLRTVFS